MATPKAEQQNPLSVSNTMGFFRTLGVFENLPELSDRRNFYSDLIRGILKVDRIERGRVTCSLTVKPGITNPYNTLHGGVVAAVAETVALACARTVAGDKEFFLGESNTAYLSAAKLNVEVEVDGCLLRQGRNVIATSVEFRIKKTGQIFYTTRATFYIMPAASI